MSCFTTGGPGKEHRTNKPPPTRRVQEGSKGDTTCPITSQNPSVWHPFGWTTSTLPGRTLESEWLVKDNLETNPITVKPKTASHAAELFSWVPLPYCSPPVPFPNKISCFVSTLVSSDNSFLSVRHEPRFGPWKGSPFLQQSDSWLAWWVLMSTHEYFSFSIILDYAWSRVHPCFLFSLQ